MSEETRLKCDIRGRYETETKPICKVRIEVQTLTRPCGEDDKIVLEWESHMTTKAVDMCPEALARAVGFAQRGVTRPGFAYVQPADLAEQPQPAEGAGDE